MNKPFREVNVGEKFKYNNAEYTKINVVKVSCCQSINAQKVDNEQNRIFVQPLQEVEVDDQL